MTKKVLKMQMICPKIPYVSLVFSDILYKNRKTLGIN